MMNTKALDIKIATNDLIIRNALKKNLRIQHSNDSKVRIIEELGVHHGLARVDIAVINGFLHGYEIKSDRDTLDRLPDQVMEFSEVFDQMTLVVGKRHLYKAINMVPDWWGIVIAKKSEKNKIIFNVIRKSGQNINQNEISVAKLLWKEEALKILEDYDQACGYYSKPRNLIYQKLTTILDKQTLGRKIRETLIFRSDWQPDSLLILNGD